jgi:hypothetical protein
MALASKNNPLLETFSNVLKASSFKKERHNWCRVQGETTLVIGLVKSSWANSYDVDVGIWFNRLGALPRPRPELCHVDARLPVSRDVKLALHLDEPVEGVADQFEWRARLIREFLEGTVILWQTAAAPSRECARLFAPAMSRVLLKLGGGSTNAMRRREPARQRPS